MCDQLHFQHAIGWLLTLWWAMLPHLYGWWPEHVSDVDVYVYVYMCILYVYICIYVYVDETMYIYTSSDHTVHPVLALTPIDKYFLAWPGDQWLFSCFSTSRVTHPCPSCCSGRKEQQIGNAESATRHQFTVRFGCCSAMDKLSCTFHLPVPMDNWVLKAPDCRRLFVVPLYNPNR